MPTMHKTATTIDRLVDAQIAADPQPNLMYNRIERDTRRSSLKQMFQQAAKLGCGCGGCLKPPKYRHRNPPCPNGSS